jgi:hypothetical protein
MGWVAFLDIYGFSAAVSHSEKTKSLQNIFATLELAYKDFLQKRPSPPAIYRLSDNIFFVRQCASNVSDSNAAFEKLLHDIRVLISIYVKNDLPLRGGVAYGEVAMDANVLVGSAVARAVEYEKWAMAPVVIVPESELDAAGILHMVGARQDITVTPTNQSDGTMRALLVRPTDETDYVDYAKKQYLHFRRAGPFNVASAWKEAWNRLETGKP